MLFTHLTRILAWLALVHGSMKLLFGFLIASGKIGTPSYLRQAVPESGLP
jgi:hypothetical protein